MPKKRTRKNVIKKNITALMDSVNAHTALLIDLLYLTADTAYSEKVFVTWWLKK